MANNAVVEQDMKNLQENLSLIRSAAGWTAADLADLIGVTKQTISNLETRKTKMSKTQYLAIQMVISLKIADEKKKLLEEHKEEDSKLELLMKNIVMKYDEEPEDTAEQPPHEDVPAHIDIETKKTCTATSNEAVIATGAAIGAVAAAGTLGSTVAALAGPAAILGATLLPWISRTFGDDKDNKK